MDDSDSSGSTGSGAKLRIFPNKVTTTRIENVGGLTIAHLLLEKPSNLIDCTIQKNGCLYILDATDGFSLRILREVNHENILHLEAVISPPSSPHNLPGDKYYLCVDEYNGNLDTEFNSLFAKSYTADVMLSNIRNYLRQVFDGIDELRNYGLYHGNLNLTNTYVQKNPLSGAVTVKLADFKEKANELLYSQFEDWVSVGNMILEISNLYHSLNPLHQMNILLLNGLGAFLQQLPHNLLIHEVKMKALGQVFFWDKSKRTSFFVHGIIAVLDHKDFIQSVQALNFIPSNWITDDHAGVLDAMNSNRKDKYQGGRHEYIKFVSGSYTHEEELKDQNKLSPQVVVDDIITNKHPTLCLELVQIVRDLGVDV